MADSDLGLLLTREEIKKTMPETVKLLGGSYDKIFETLEKYKEPEVRYEVSGWIELASKNFRYKDAIMALTKTLGDAELVDRINGSRYPKSLEVSSFAALSAYRSLETFLEDLMPGEPESCSGRFECSG